MGNKVFVDTNRPAPNLEGIREELEAEAAREAQEQKRVLAELLESAQDLRNLGVASEADIQRLQALIAEGLLSELATPMTEADRETLERLARARKS